MKQGMIQQITGLFPATEPLTGQVVLIMDEWMDFLPQEPILSDSLVYFQFNVCESFQLFYIYLLSPENWWWRYDTDKLFKLT